MRVVVGWVGWVAGGWWLAGGLAGLAGLAGWLAWDDPILLEYSFRMAGLGSLKSPTDPTKCMKHSQELKNKPLKWKTGSQ